MELSLLDVISSNATNITEEELDETFCRDTEAFSDAFQVDNLHHLRHLHHLDLRHHRHHLYNCRWTTSTTALQTASLLAATSVLCSTTGECWQ